MIQRTIIDASKKEIITLAQVKSALGFGSRIDKDDEITNILDAAIAQVEEVGDVSLRAYNVQVSYDYADTENALYLQPVNEINSIKSFAGEDMDYRVSVDKRRFFLSYPKPCVAQYTTMQIDEKQAARYVRAIIELCMFMFSGSTDGVEHGNILRKIRTTI